ncbi:MAG: phosphoribosylformylglycinamidine synthase subunit PurQ [Desulfobacterales bacterium]|nr:phosphoribosylformylglycinamidine synthase subunit PurQ [Desulfobacterales bacterium]
MKKKVKSLVLSGYGLNCDHETAYILEMAGAEAVRVHINELISGIHHLSDFQLLVFVGGFSWADDHGAGLIQALKLKTNLEQAMLQFIESGNLVLGICNGFQTLVNMGLLPGFDQDYTKRHVALVDNECGNFRNAWVNLKVNSTSPCIFTRGMDHLEFPVRHGQGKFYTYPDNLSKLFQNNQVVLQYTKADGTLANGEFPYNPNGSLSDIAGICDPTGKIFGLMPHPEAFHMWANHPLWHQEHERIKRKQRPEFDGLTHGIRLFKNAIDYIQESVM